MLPSNDYTSENVSVRVSVTFPIIGTFEYSSLVGNTYFSVRYEVLSPVCQGCSNITTRWSQNVIIRQQTLSTKLCQAKFCLEAWCVGDASFKGFFILFFTPMKDHKTKMKYLLTTPCFAAMSDDVSITLAKNEAVFRKWSLPFSQHLQIQLQAFLIYTEIGQHLKMLKFRHFRNVIDTGIINKTSKVWSQRVPFNIEQLSFHQAFWKFYELK